MLATDAARLVHVHIRVGQHLGVHAQILQVALRNHGAHNIRQSTDTQLNRRTIFQQRHHVAGNQAVGFAGLGFRQLQQAAVRAFNHHVDLGNMDRFVQTAEATRVIGIHFDHHLLGLAAVGGRHGAAGRKIEKAIGIHRRHLHHGDIRLLVHGHILRTLVIAQRNIAGQTDFAIFARQAGKMPVIPDKRLALRIGFHALEWLGTGGGHQNHVAQFVFAQGQGDIHGFHVLGKLAHEYGVARLHQRSSLLRRTAFLLVLDLCGLCHVGPR